MALFVLGHVVCTRGVNDAIADSASFAEFVTGCLKRHASGDWSNMDEQDQKENNYAIGKYLRIFSAYKHCGRKIWIITEADRSVTTVLFPNEY